MDGQQDQDGQRDPDGQPFDVIVEIAAGADAGPWERAGATWVFTGFGMQPTRSSVLAAIDSGPW